MAFADYFRVECTIKKWKWGVICSVCGLTLCDLMDCSLPGSSVHGIFHASTGVGRHFLLQGIFPTQGSNQGLLHCRQILYQLSYQGSPIILYNSLILKTPFPKVDYYHIFIFFNKVNLKIGFILEFCDTIGGILKIFLGYPKPGLKVCQLLAYARGIQRWIRLRSALDELTIHLVE